MQTLNRNGVNLAYQEAGSGAPPILLVHGFCGNHTHLAPQFDHFRRHHRVVAVDRRGHGHSDKPDQAYTIQGFADDLAWLCRELGLYKPVVVVHSMGAIGLELAARFPDLPAALVLLDTPFSPPPEVQAGFQQLLEGLRSPAYREVLRQVGDNLIFLPTDNQQRKAQLVEAMAEVPQQVIVSTWENFLAYNPEAAAECRVPLLHLGSVFPANLARWQELCPQLVTGQTVGAGHFHQLEVPEQVNVMIDRFLAITLNGGGKMTEISGQVSILINAPTPEVYAYLLDFTRHPEWVKNLQRVRPESGGPIQVGTTFQTQEGPPPVALRQKLPMMFHFLTGVLSGAKTYSRAEITELEPNRRIAWKAGVPKGEGYFNLAQWKLLLEPQGQATCLTQRFVYQPQNDISRRMIDAAGAKGLEQACGLSLEQLKQRLERHSA